MKFRVFSLMSIVALFVLCNACGEQGAKITYLDQGWSFLDRGLFYTTSQGSQMMPLAWFLALEQAGNNEPFIGDGTTVRLKIE